MCDILYTRKVKRDGTFTVRGKAYQIDDPGYEGEMIVVHYNSRTGEVDRIEGRRLMRSSVHPLRYEYL